MPKIKQIENLQSILDSKVNNSQISTDINLGTSDVLVPSQNAVKSFVLSNTFTLEFTTKSSAFDGGVLGEIAFDDDYFYICVQAGTPGNARWKKLPLTFSA